MEPQNSLRIRIFKAKNWVPQQIPFSAWGDEESHRVGVARQVKLSLFRKQPILLQTSRWSGADRFLASVCRSLADREDPSGDPIFIKQLSFGRDSLSENWLKFLSNFNVLVPDKNTKSKTLRVLVTRRGFRSELCDIFQKLGNQPKPKAALIFSKVERWPLSIIEDIQLAWNQAYENQNSDKIVPLVISGAISGGHFQKLIWLKDYSANEVIELLSPDQPLSAFLHEAIYLSGGIPALVFILQRVLTQADPTIEKLEQKWQPIIREIQQVIDIVSAKRKLLYRLQQLSDSIKIHKYQPIDEQLVQAGLAQLYYSSQDRAVKLRAPYFAKLIQ